GEVHGAADLLVKEHVPAEPLDPVVRADSYLAKVRSAVVGREERLQQVLASGCARLDDLSVLKGEANILDLFPGVNSGEAEADRAVGRILHRSGEDLSVGEVALAVGADPRPSPHAKREVGPVADDPQLVEVRQPLDEPALFL